MSLKNIISSIINSDCLSTWNEININEYYSKKTADEGKPERTIFLINQASKMKSLKYKEIWKKSKLEFVMAESNNYSIHTWEHSEALPQCRVVVPLKLLCIPSSGNRSMPLLNNNIWIALAENKETFHHTQAGFFTIEC